MPSSFPTTIDSLVPYLYRAIRRLNSNAARLGVEPTKLTAINNLYGDVATPETYLYYKGLWNDEGMSRTKMVTKNLRSISTRLKKELAAIYNDIPASKWNNEDRITFNRKTGLAYEKTFRRAAIKFGCSASVKTPGNGVISIKVGKLLESGDSRDNPAADAIEVAYAIVESNFRAKTDADTEVKKKCIGPNDAPKHLISTKTKIKLELDIAYKGFNLVFWCRWTNIRNPALAGTWSEGHEIMIS